MRQILKFLATDGAFLYAEHGFRIIDSKYDSSFGGTGSVTLSDGAIDFIFDYDRDRLLLETRASGRTSRKFGYSFDLVAEMLTGEVGRGPTNAENAVVLRTHMAKLVELFSKANTESTEATLTLLKQQCLKRQNKADKAAQKLKSRPADETN